MENKDAVLIDLAQRMSLRPPQKQSLERLAAAVDAAGLKKGTTAEELETQLAAVRALSFEGVDLPPAADYDWSFLSFAFALATGVGKAREREFSALESIPDQYEKIVLSLDRFDFSRNGVRHAYLPDYRAEDARTDPGEALVTSARMKRKNDHVRWRLRTIRDYLI